MRIGGWGGGVCGRGVEAPLVIVKVILVLLSSASTS